MVRYRKWRALEKLYKVIDNKIKNNGFKTLFINGIDNKNFNLVVSVLRNFGDRSNILLKDHFLRLWKKKAEDIKVNELSMNELGTLFRKSLKNKAINLLYLFSICKKLNDLMIKMKLSKAMKKIKEKVLFVKKLTNLKELLKKSQNELIDANKIPISRKILKIYSFKVLSNFFKNMKNNLKPQFYKYVLTSLKDYVTKLSENKNIISNLGSFQIKEIQITGSNKSVARSKKMSKLGKKLKMQIKYIT